MGHTPRIVVGAVFVFMTTFMGVTVFGDENDVWRKWFYDYQTMCAGVLAIGAAYLTIVETRRIDGEQARRHRELVELQLRGDAALAERAAVEAFLANKTLGDLCDTITFDTTVGNELSLAGTTDTELNAAVGKRFPAIRMMTDEFLENTEIEAAKALYPSSIFIELRGARMWLEAFRKLDTEYGTSADRRRVSEAVSALSYAREELERFARSAQRFSDKYKET